MPVDAKRPVVSPPTDQIELELLMSEKEAADGKDSRE